MIDRYDISISSSVVRQEFKRRLLSEALYLLRQLNKLKSYKQVLRHVTDVLPRGWARKKQICLDILLTIHEASSDDELTERARRYMRTLLTQGLRTFDARTGSILPGVGCIGLACSVLEVRPYESYRFTPDRCSKAAGKCGVANFFAENADLSRRILEHLRSQPDCDKPGEIAEAERFLEVAIRDPLSLANSDPCSKVGDLLIALESKEIPTFYTINKKESKVLCPFFHQELIMRPSNPTKDDEIISFH